MKHQPLTTLLTVTALTSLSILTLSTSVKADSKVQFICNTGYDETTQKRLPTTYAWYQGQKRALIRWEKSLGGQTPRQRCEQISPRFQEAYNNGTLNIITNGRMNNQPVICTAREYEGPCVTLLMTLRPTDKPLEVLNDLKDVFSGRALGPMRHSSGDSQIYYEIDLEETLRNAPVEK